MTKKKIIGSQKPEFVDIPLFEHYGADREAIADESIKSIRLKEHEFRASAEIYTDQPVPISFPPIILPYRWEALEAEAQKRNISLKPLIMPVQRAIAEVEKELKRIKETGMGRLLVISGVT